jgi:hypothetical protein
VFAELLRRHHDDHPARRVDDRCHELGPQTPSLGEDRPAGHERAQVVERPLEPDREPGQGARGHVLRGLVEPRVVGGRRRRFAESQATRDATVVVRTCVVEVVVVGGDAVSQRQNPGNGRLSRPLRATDPQCVAHRAERILELGHAIILRPDQATLPPQSAGTGAGNCSQIVVGPFVRFDEFELECF